MIYESHYHLAPHPQLPHEQINIKNVKKTENMGRDRGFFEVTSGDKSAYLFIKISVMGTGLGNYKAVITMNWI